MSESFQRLLSARLRFPNISFSKLAKVLRVSRQACFGVLRRNIGKYPELEKIFLVNGYSKADLPDYVLESHRRYEKKRREKKRKRRENEKRLIEIRRVGIEKCRSQMTPEKRREAALKAVETRRKNLEMLLS